MRKTAISLLISALSIGSGIFAAEPRTTDNIDFDWYFHPGDMTDGQNDSVNYKTWRLLDVPHDWSIECEYSEKNRRENGFLPSGICWYKKEIDWNNYWNGKLVNIEFDGIFVNSTVWLNGKEIGHRPNGYQGINYDLTPYLKKGKNILSVRVDNSRLPSSRWYQGTGIYRHVYLNTTDSIHVARYGTFVSTPEVTKDNATVAVETEIRNETDWPVNVKVLSVITDANGSEVARGERRGRINCTKGTLNDTLSIIHPSLWSPDTPYVYTLNTIVEHDGKVVDRYQTTFGVRKLEFGSDFGFKLNGKPTKLKGVCLHQNMGAAGSAFHDEIWLKRLRQMKEMGCNAVRTSHYPYSPEFYNICDTLGLMVVDEPWDGWFDWDGCHKAACDYTNVFLEWWERDLAEFIKRDRNHPSVVMWSLGNEVWGFERHMYLQWKMNDTFHKLDPTRPTTQAYALEKHIDIAGFNANGERIGDLEAFHKKQPEKLAVGTEIPHTRQTRGVYRSVGAYNSFNGPDNVSEETRKGMFPVTSFTAEEIFPEYNAYYASSYDNQPRQISNREQWKQTRDNDWFIGQFLWTGIDYIGESWGWPTRTNNFGIVDLAGFPKDTYYLYQSLWSDKPMIHLLPHWTWPGKEGVEIPMVAYTNGDEAELFLNGKSLGRQPMHPDSLQIVWMVPYKVGTLTAVAYRNGKEIARTQETTAGKPARIRLTPDRDSMHANRRDVLYVTADIIDAKGNFVPYADNKITFEVTGPYRLIGVENGDILDMNPHKVMHRNAFMGKALLMLQSTDEPGLLRISAKSPGLKSSAVSVRSK